MGAPEIKRAASPADFAHLMLEGRTLEGLIASKRALAEQHHQAGTEQDTAIALRLEQEIEALEGKVHEHYVSVLNNSLPEGQSFDGRDRLVPTDDQGRKAAERLGVTKQNSANAMIAEIDRVEAWAAMGIFTPAELRVQEAKHPGMIKTTIAKLEAASRALTAARTVDIKDGATTWVDNAEAHSNSAWTDQNLVSFTLQHVGPSVGLRWHMKADGEVPVVRSPLLDKLDAAEVATNLAEQQEGTIPKNDPLAQQMPDFIRTYRNNDLRLRIDLASKITMGGILALSPLATDAGLAALDEGTRAALEKDFGQALAIARVMRASMKDAPAGFMDDPNMSHEGWDRAWQGFFESQMQRYAGNPAATPIVDQARAAIGQALQIGHSHRG